MGNKLRKANLNRIWISQRKKPPEDVIMVDLKSGNQVSQRASTSKSRKTWRVGSSFSEKKKKFWFLSQRKIIIFGERETYDQLYDRPIADNKLIMWRRVCRKPAGRWTRGKTELKPRCRRKSRGGGLR